jgi:hypothetical protein
MEAQIHRQICGAGSNWQFDGKIEMVRSRASENPTVKIEILVRFGKSKMVRISQS